VPGHSFIDGWISVLDEARERVLASSPADPQRALELEGVKTSLANLRTFPFVRAGEEAGSLKLHGAFFAISDGILHVLDEDSGEFAPA
jgi:carbonic anhydrase